MSTRLALPLAFAVAAILAGCATPSAAPPAVVHYAGDTQDAWDAWHRELDRLLPADAILLGEQHDAPEHHALEKATVAHLAARQRLAAVVLEMADAGTRTTDMPANASDEDVRQALRWNDKGWPWTSYGPTVMAAVRAQIPVLGGNLPRANMAQAMKNTELDGKLNAEALQMQIDAIQKGHCGLLPETQLLPMARIQLARDDSMARTVAAAAAAAATAQPGRTVLLIAGNGHVRDRLGVARWLPDGLVARKVMAQAGEIDPAIKPEADAFVVTPQLPAKDHCAELRKQWKR
ncbi:hypothetical protein SDC9_89689 [bioreactor metagenome]|uniref:Haem-binding uptake Tiki superfamily ChaN domain-containing protein n=1 Tax=bioreactor metagenome TaxID=1076179 RepID=A0A644ZQI4_9ZZZZ